MNKVLWYVGILVTLCISPSVLAQTVYEGKIVEEGTGRLVSDVICSATDLKGEKVFAYTMSGEQGEYRLRFYAEVDSVCLRFALLGYKNVVLICKNVSGQKDITFVPTQFQLKEVTVKAAPMWSVGDTLNYRVEAFQGGEDRVIGDVLKKLPGIKVSENGAITYQGEPINRFYIEGLDLLRAKYGIATNNIPADAVEKVQVLENHQPVKLLRDQVFSQQAAINLKLKKEKLGRPVINAEAGGGFTSSEGLWEGKLMAMEMARSWQSLYTFKTNNTGRNLTDELSDHGLGMADLLQGVPPYPTDLMESGSLIALPVDEKRYLQNQSYAATANQLWKIDEDSQLRLVLTYLKNRDREQRQELNRYQLGTEEELLWNTLNQLRDDSHRAEAVFSWTTNASSVYVDDELKFYGNWRDVASGVSGSQQVDQDFRMPLFLIQNKLDLVKRTGKSNWNLYSFIRYTGQPQRLDVAGDTVQFGQVGLLKQRTDRQKFYTTNRTGFSRQKGKSLFRLDVAFTAALEHLSSDLRPGLFEVSQNNRLQGNRWEYQLQPEYTLRGERGRLTIGMPLVFLDLYADHRSIPEKEHFSRLWTNPSVRYHYTFNPYWKASLSYRMQKELGDALDFTEGVRMTNFRTFRKGISIPEQRTSHSYSASFTYRNPINVLFTTLSVIYRMQHSNLVSAQTLTENHILQYREKRDNDRRYLMINGRLGKYWDGWRTNLSVDAGYTRMSFNQFQQQKEWKVTGHTAQVTVNIDCEPVSWNRVNLQIAYKGNKTGTARYVSDWLSDWKSGLSLHFFPAPYWQVTWKGEYVNNEIADAPDLRLFFMDAEVRYSLPRWEVALRCENICDKHTYAFSSYDGVNTFSTSYALRRRAVLVSLGFKL